MQLRYLKDLAVTLIVIIFLVLGVRLYTNYFKMKSVPDQSVHSKESVSDSLLTKIKAIETPSKTVRNLSSPSPVTRYVRAISSKTSLIWSVSSWIV